MSKTSNVILGFLSGAAIGLVAGILTAPDKGENTRAKIKDKVKDIKDLTDNISDNIEEKINQLNEQIEQLKKETKGKINDINKTTDKNKTQM